MHAAAPVVRRTLLTAALLGSAADALCQVPVHELAQRVDTHYNHLTTLRTTYTERYRGMGQQREEHGTLLLKKPGRMRWTYADGKLFILDGKSAVSYTPGDPQAQRVPAKQLDDLRSPLRFLLGHTQIEKELDHLTASSGANGTVTLSGSPRYRMAAAGSEERVQAMAITVNAGSGEIVGLKLTEIDGATTEFRFSQLQENVPASDAEFRFVPPAGVTIVEGLPPA